MTRLRIKSSRGLLAALACSALLACAGADPEAEAGDTGEASAAVRGAWFDVPPALEVPAGNRLAFYLEAEGVQIYSCQLTATGPSWQFVAPEATLFRPNGHAVGTHYAGPTWQYRDGSKVVAARVAGVTTDPTAIPELLLKATSNQGPGKFAGTTFIQRLETVGGLAPSTGCDAQHAGAVARVDYTATYVFYEARHHHTGN